MDEVRWLYVGIYNHRHYFNSRDEISASAEIVLEEDAEWARQHVPDNWIADMYDPFHDIMRLGLTRREDYPEGEKFMYDVKITDDEDVRLEVRIFRDRLTLLHIENPSLAQALSLTFVSGPSISHVLTSTRASPKTFFDFDHLGQAVPVSNNFQIIAGGQRRIWCAIFGAQDGFVQLDVSTRRPPEPSLPVSFAMVCVIVLLAGAGLLVVAHGGAQKLVETVGGRSAGFSSLSAAAQRVTSWVKPRSNHESVASLTRGSLNGYMGSDVIDRSVEDQYLHRGGIGDDGI